MTQQDEQLFAVRWCFAKASEYADKASHLNAALHLIDEYCRSQIEYGEHDDKTVTTLKTIREMMPEIM